MKFGKILIFMFISFIAPCNAMEPANENPEVWVDEMLATFEKIEPYQEIKEQVQVPWVKAKQSENMDKCILCNKACAFASLKKHYEAQHKLDSKIYYTCTICAAEINHSSTMRSHLIKQHQIENDNVYFYYKRSIKVLGTNS